MVNVSWNIPREELMQGYSHLQDINFPQLEEQSLDLLIRSSLYEAYFVADLRLSFPGQPYGIHTILGWTIYGKDEFPEPARVMVNFRKSGGLSNARGNKFCRH